GDQPLGEPALADSRFADEQVQATVAGERLVETASQLGELCLAPDEGAPRRFYDGGISGRREIEGGVLAEDRALELAQLAARLDPEPIDERATRGLVGLERLRLPARAVEHEHQLPAQVLTQRIGSHQALELTRELEATAQPDLAVAPPLARPRAQLLDPRDLRRRDPLVGETGEGPTAPERERPAEELGRLPQADGLRLQPQPLEPRLVELVGVYPQQ